MGVRIEGGYVYEVNIPIIITMVIIVVITIITIIESTTLFTVAIENLKPEKP